MRFSIARARIREEKLVCAASRSVGGPRGCRVALAVPGTGGGPTRMVVGASGSSGGGGGGTAEGVGGTAVADEDDDEEDADAADRDRNGGAR